MTPLEGVKACKSIAPKELDHLERKLSEINPFVLREVIEAKLRKIWKLQESRERKLAA
jgi:hypothetical protein